MIEKYGVSEEDMPASDDQIRMIIKLLDGNKFEMPQTRKEAQNLINELIQSGRK